MTTERAKNWLTIGVLIAILGGCANAGQKTGEYIDDSWITSKVKSQMLANKTVKGTNITAEIARNVQGVKEVENDIRVQ